MLANGTTKLIQNLNKKLNVVASMLKIGLLYQILVEYSFHLISE